MKTLSLEKMESVEGGGCGFAANVVLTFYSSGIGFAFSVVSGPVGLIAGIAAGIAVAAVCEFT